MEKRKKRFWSMMLSLVMMVGLLWAVPGNAATSIAGDTTGEAGVWTYDGDALSAIEKDDDGHSFVIDDSNNRCGINDLKQIIATGSGIYISGGYVIGDHDKTQVDATQASVIIGDNNGLECKSFDGDAVVTTNGIMKCDTFNGSLENDGSFNCGSFSGKATNRSQFTCSGSFSGSIQNGDDSSPSATFKAGSFTSSGETTISNYGTMTIDGTFDASAGTFTNATAVYADSIVIGTVTDSDTSEYYASESIDLGDGVKGAVKVAPTTKIKVNSNKKFNLYIDGVQVNPSGVGFDSSDGGECYAYEFLPAVDPESNNFDTDDDGNYLSMTSYDGDDIHTDYGDGKFYVKNKINLHAQSGYKVKFGDGDFSDYVTIDKDTYENKIKDKESEFKLYRESDYRIGSVKAIQANSNINNIVFDSTEPKVTASADGKTITDEIETQELTITITASDANLNPEVAYKIGNDSTEQIEKMKSDGSSYTATFTINAEPGKPKDCQFSVWDRSGNTSSVNFKLIFKKYDFSADLSMSDVYYGQALKPTISNPSGTWDVDGPSYEYKADVEDTYSTTEPKAAGKYWAKAVFTGSDSFNDFTTDAVSFEIKRYDIKDFEVTVASKTLEDGEEDDNSYELGYNEPDDWRKFGGDDSKIKVEYKKTDGDGSYSEEPPSKSGTYVVKVTLQETDKYNSVSAESEPFEISKAKLNQFTLNKVDDIEVGAAFKPNLSVDSAYDGNITYKYKLATETDYGDTEIEEGAVITDSGEYTAKAIAKGSDLYEAAESNEVSFKVTKKNITIEVSAADVIVGETVSPVIVSPTSFDPELDVDIQYVYKGKGEGETAYTSEIPVNPGDYTVKAIISGSKRYEDTSATTSFTISKMDDSTAKVEVPDTVVGTEYEPVLTTMSDGKSSAKFEYKLADADDSTYSETKPTEPGKYVIRVTVPVTDKYAEQICTDEFTISEAETPDKEENKEEEQKEEEQPEDNLLTAKASVEVPDVYVGVTYNPILTTDSDGKDKAVFEYKSADDKDGEYSFDKPVKAGKYIVRATVPETDKYHEVRCEATFTISKITAKDSSVKISDIYVGTKIAPILISDSDGKAKAVFEYKKADDKDSAYSKTEPTKAGKYSVRATIPETDKYLKVVCESTFSILKITPEASVKLSDQYAGTKEYKPVLSTDSDGKSKAYFEYKAKDASDDEYSKTKPTKEGEYVVRATIPETEKYKKTTCDAEFSLIYLKDDSITYKVTGDSGRNGFYVSDVYIVAPKGYAISTTRDGIYSKRIKYNSDIKKVYLRRESDGAQLEEIEIKNEIKVDKDMPKLVKAVDENNDEVELSGSNDLYADRLTLTFEDEHIISVKVNGQFAAPNDKNITVVLDSEGGEKFYEVVVEDLAGNKYSSSITLSAAWMRDNTLPSGSRVRLRSGNGYKLNSGSWKVDGDATVYSGGCMVYVNSDGDYTFEAQ